MTALLVRDPLVAAPFRLMDEFVRSMGNGSRVTGFTPPLDVFESDDKYYLTVDVPGVRPEDVTIEVNDQLLSISGSRLAPAHGEVKLSERPYGAFDRTVSLPKGVDSDAIVAEFRDGVLELQIPKPEAKRPKRIPIANIVEQPSIGS